jgi:Histidine kinase-, DNA gyrase B-, and HSP90-like ATPase
MSWDGIVPLTRGSAWQHKAMLQGPCRLQSLLATHPQDNLRAIGGRGAIEGNRLSRRLASSTLDLGANPSLLNTYSPWEPHCCASNRSIPPGDWCDTMAKFTVDTHLFRELGDLLVGRDSTALVELIKNAYDADATSVLVYGEALEDRERGVIRVSDDGVGMSMPEFEHGFLRIASRSKEQGSRVSKRFKRRYTGAQVSTCLRGRICGVGAELG